MYLLFAQTHKHTHIVQIIIEQCLVNLTATTNDTAASSGTLNKPLKLTSVCYDAGFKL